MLKAKYDLIIIGGGLAGLACALHLSKQSLNILVIEKQSYPHHKVCGEYISNEILPYLNSLGIFPMEEGAKAISEFQISSKHGVLAKNTLPLGGFGISRYALDHLLYKEAETNSDFLFDTVTKVHFKDHLFNIESQKGHHISAKYVVGAFGKRSNLDISWSRNFTTQRSPWLGVKAHYDFEFPDNLVALHNFEGGYCGLSKVESGAVNACYLTTFNSFKTESKISDFQKNVMSQNRHLADFFGRAKLLFEKPLSISQISFESKEPVFNHIFMIGDSAGLIHPLCGNGMAMAIHSAKIFSELFIKHINVDDNDRAFLEMQYSKQWKRTFTSRLRTGRRVQSLLLNPKTADIGIRVAQMFPSIIPRIIKKTHGKTVI